MVVSNTQSRAPCISLDFSLENLSFSSAAEDLVISPEDISLHHLSPVDGLEEFKQANYQSPFDVWYMKEDVWPSRACSHSFGDANSNEFSSDFDWSSPTSPINTPSPQKRGAPLSPLAKRESLLQKAWERKRELYLKQELVNLKERANVRTLGRSASDCGKLARAHAQRELLERSMSDCSKAKKDPFITPNRLRRTHSSRSLTDDDFEELKGCLDLGFRFDQSSIPDLCDTLPALEAVCAVTQNFQESSPIQSSTPSPTPSWRITSPGDDPKEVREKLRHWAQAVACSARLCY